MDHQLLFIFKNRENKDRTAFYLRIIHGTWNVDISQI